MMSLRSDRASEHTVERYRIELAGTAANGMEALGCQVCHAFDPAHRHKVRGGRIEADQGCGEIVPDIKAYSTGYQDFNYADRNTPGAIDYILKPSDR